MPTLRKSSLRRPLYACGVVAASALFALPVGFGCTAPAREDDAKPAASDESNIEEAADGVFKSTKDFSFAIEAPFTQLFTRFRSGQADPPKPKKDAGPDADADADPEPDNDKPDYSEAGKIVYGDKTLDVRVGIRGNTSPRDCTFPKYKIDFTEKKQLVGTPFQGNRKIRVNSHCGSGGPNDRAGQFNRVQNEISPIREELTYRIVRAAGVPTYRTRIAKIAYTDSSAASPLAPMTQHGLLIESGDVAAKRFAADGLIDKEKGIYLNDPAGRATNAGADCSQMKDDDVARVYFAEALTANFDWIFTIGKPGSTWNVDVFGVPNEASQLPIPQDFDLASSVQALRDPTNEVTSQIGKLRRQFAAKPDVVTRVAASFKANKEAIEKDIADAEKAGIAAKRLPSTDGVTTTDPGFINAKKQVEAFFALAELTN